MVNPHVQAERASRSVRHQGAPPDVWAVGQTHELQGALLTRIQLVRTGWARLLNPLRANGVHPGQPSGGLSLRVPGFRTAPTAQKPSWVVLRTTCGARAEGVSYAMADGAHHAGPRDGERGAR